MKQQTNNKPVVFRVPDNLTESYIITSSRRKIGIYGERFLDILAQATVQEQKGEFSNGIKDVRKVQDDGSYYLSFSIDRVMANAVDRNYDDAEEALRSLSSIFFEYKDDKVWKSRALITDPKIDKLMHTATFRIPREIWEAIKDRDHGYRRFSPRVAYNVASEYSYRLYKLVAGQKYPLRYKLQELKLMLNCGDKYKKLADFQKRILDACREDLKSCADWYYEYKMFSSEEAKKAVKRGRPALDIVEFYPKENFFVKRDAVAATGGDSFEILPYEVQTFLLDKIGFTKQEVKNSRVIIPAYEIMKRELLTLLYDNIVRIDGAESKKPYVVNLIKRKVYEDYGELLGATTIDDSKKSKPNDTLF